MGRFVVATLYIGLGDASPVLYRVYKDDKFRPSEHSQSSGLLGTLLKCGKQDVWSYKGSVRSPERLFESS